MIGSGKRHRIVSTGIPGMATAQTLCTKQAALEKTMLFNGFLGIAGTGRVETAMAGHQRADSVAIHLDHSECEVTHWMLGVRNGVNVAAYPLTGIACATWP